jgi:hypothetical protein
MNSFYEKFGSLGILITLLIVTVLGLTAMADDYTVTQGSTSQVITPLTKQESAASFYDYSDFEAHTDPNVELANETVLFLYKSQNTGKLSLIVIHHDGENPIDPNNYQYKEASLTFSGIPPSAQVAVEDDPEDDDYTLNSSISWGWPDYRTDGIVITDLGEDFTITVDPNFITGINDWKIATGDINNPTYVSMDMTEPLEITSEATTPDSPTSLSGSPLSTSEIELNWTDNSNDEDGFRIYRDGSSVDTVGANTTSYTDTGLSSGTTYTYEVAAYNASGESAKSNQVDVTTNSGPGPDSEYTVDANTWNLLSIPLLPNPDDCPSVIGDDLPAGEDCDSLTWGPWDGTQFTDLTNMSPFEGFWLWAPSQITLGVSGTIPTDKEVTLMDRSGWFMIGTPVEITWGNVRLKENGGSFSKIKNIDVTSADSPIYNALYEYDPSADDFIVDTQPDWDDFVLDRWKGYYIYIQQNADTPITLDFGQAEGPPVPPDPESLTQGIRLKEIENENLLVPPEPPVSRADMELLEVSVSSTATGDSSEVTFEIGGTGATSISSFEILVKNSAGETIFSSETAESKITWNTEGVSNGVYLYAATVRGEAVSGTDIGKFLVLN